MSLIETSEAIALLMNHAGLVEGPRLDDGILGMLRPYRGIVERNIHEVVDCLFHLRDRLSNDTIQREILQSTLMFLANLRALAILPEGLLQRNHLIDHNSSNRLEDWCDIIESTTLGYMASQDHAIALRRYMQYLNKYHVAELFFQSAVVAAISDAFLQDDDYKLIAINLCVKYPLIGSRFREQAEALLTVVKPGELQDAAVRFLRSSN